MDFRNLPAYELVREEELTDIGSHGVILRHRKSGARIMLVANDDDNKVFNIIFRTTPTDSTGVAHIIEHTVLCGSRSFPSKDPFVELVKGSMNTFLNAITYPDKTMYPVASCNQKDFENLMHVYLDAVFYPNIYKKEEIFRQEGWSYQLEKPEDELVINGVVYNEMKGAYSSPDDVLERRIMESLFPDTTYGVDSGGEPERIPDLTYETYLDFHRTYYHPSNACIYLYGDMDFAERLEFLDREYLCHFDRKEVDSEIRLQAPFTKEPVWEFYPAAEDEPEEHNTYLSRNFVCGTSTDTTLTNAVAVLEYVLLEAPGAPLKTALLRAGIGQDVYSSYDSGIRQPVLSIIAKNADAEDLPRFLAVIEDTLSQMLQTGLSEKALEAAVNSMEFKFREADFGGYPKGLVYSLDVCDSWLYDEELPFAYLQQLEVYRFLREQIGTSYYTDLIRTLLLENPHTSVLVLRPSKGMAGEAEEALREKLAAYKASLSEAEIADIIARTEKLRAFQETPSTKEELECIPQLTREDLKQEVRPYANVLVQRQGGALVTRDVSEDEARAAWRAELGRVEDAAAGCAGDSADVAAAGGECSSSDALAAGGSSGAAGSAAAAAAGASAGATRAQAPLLVHHAVPTNGIDYVTLLFDLSPLAPEDWPYAGILKKLLGEVDTRRQSYGDLNNEINRRTGGITFSTGLFQDAEEPEKFRAALTVSISTLPAELDFAFDITREILQESVFTDDKRLLEILRKIRSRTQSRLSSAGHVTALNRALSYISASHRFDDATGGVAFYDEVCALEEHFDERADELRARMTDILRRILRPEGLIAGYTGDAAQMEQVYSCLENFSAAFEAAAAGDGEAQASAAADAGDPADRCAAAAAGSGTAAADGSAAVDSCSAAGGQTGETDAVETAGTTADILPLHFMRGEPIGQRNEGFLTSAKVQYVVRAGMIGDVRSRYTGALRVLKVIMSYDYLWTNVRVVGGAYGCGAAFGRSGTGAFYSYRDPQLEETIKVYEGIPEYLRTFTADERDMTKYVIGTVGDMDAPLTPRAAGSRSMVALLTGLTQEKLRTERQQVLTAQVEDIRALAPLCEEILRGENLCVVGNENRIRAAKELFKEIRPLV